MKSVTLASAAVVCVLAACGGSEAPEDAGPPASAVTAPTASAVATVAVTEAPAETEATTPETTPTTAPPTTAPPTTAPPTTLAPTTVAPTTAPPTTIAPPTTEASGAGRGPVEAGEPVLFASIDDFVRIWDGANASSNAQNADIERIEMTRESLRVGPVSGPSDAVQAFAADDLFEAGFLAGGLDADGAVTALLLIVDPDGETAAPAVLATLSAASVPWVDLYGDISFVDAFVDVFGTNVRDTNDQIGAQSVIPGPAGSPYSIVVTVIAGAQADDPLIEVAILPATDEASAVAAAGDLEIDLLSFVLG